MKPGKTFIFSCFLQTSFAESGSMFQYKIIGYIIKGVMSSCMEKRFHFPVAMDHFFQECGEECTKFESFCPVLFFDIMEPL